MFPTELLQICELIGIDVLKEGETTIQIRAASGLYLYTGEMHFIGTVDLRCRDTNDVPVHDFGTAWMCFGTGTPTVPRTFGEPVAAVEYVLELPWVIAESLGE